MKKMILIGMMLLGVSGYAKTFECSATSSLFGEINMVVQQGATQQWVKESPLDNRTKATVILKFDENLYFVAEAVKADNGSYEQISISIADSTSGARASTASLYPSTYLRLDFPEREVNSARTDRIHGQCYLK